MSEVLITDCESLMKAAGIDFLLIKSSGWRAAVKLCVMLYYILLILNYSGLEKLIYNNNFIRYYICVIFEYCVTQTDEVVIYTLPARVKRIMLYNVFPHPR